MNNFINNNAELNWALNFIHVEAICQLKNEKWTHRLTLSELPLCGSQSSIFKMLYVGKILQSTNNVWFTFAIFFLWPEDIAY